MVLLVALLASTLFLSNAIKREYSTLVDSSPDIVVINQKAMRDVLLKESAIDKILSINGVSHVVGRVSGHYRFNKADTVFKVVGIDEFETYSNPLIESLNREHSLKDNAMMISSSVEKILSENYYHKYFNFIRENGTLQKVNISKVFQTDENSKLIVMPKTLFREIFGFQNDEITDIAVSVKNKDEIKFIANKIQNSFVNAKVILKEDRKLFYEKIYNLRSGFFLMIFIITFFTFFIIIYDKISGLNSEQKREIGVLKAIGWRVEDVLKAKFYEGIVISFSAYLVGIILANIYIFIFKAPYLKKIFLNNYNLIEDYKIHFYIDYQVLVILFFLSVPIYILATIIPSWRVATIDADEVMR